jgi:YbbR domain-containing protein
VEIIRKNFALKLLAFTLAILGWAYFRFATNPIVAAARFDQQISLPIAVVNLAVGYVAHFSEHEAVVTVETKPGTPAVKPDEIKAVLDLSNKGAGVYNLPVELVAPDIAVQSLSPASVTLTVERIESRSFPVVVHFAGAPVSNAIVVAGQTLRPATVTVQGPTSELAQVTAVRVGIAFPAAPTAVDEMVRPTPVNAQGAEVTGLQVEPDLIRAQLQFAAGHGVNQP